LASSTSITSLTEFSTSLILFTNNKEFCEFVVDFTEHCSIHWPKTYSLSTNLQCDTLLISC